MLEELGAAALGIHAGRVAHVVPVGFEPAHHRILVAEQPRAAIRVAARHKRPVVTHLVGTAGRLAGIEAVAAVIVVGLPRRVGRLEQDVGMARVVAHDEDHVARAARIRANELGDVDAGCRGRRYRPGCRDAPVSAVDESCRRVSQARRLMLRQRRRRRDRRHLAGPQTRVIPQSIDVDVIRRRVGRHLETDAAAFSDADIGRIALNRVVACPDDVPLAVGVSRQLVLADDGIPRRGRTSGRLRRDCRMAVQQKCARHRRRQPERPNRIAVRRGERNQTIDLHVFTTETHRSDRPPEPEIARGLRGRSGSARSRTAAVSRRCASAREPCR